MTKSVTRGSDGCPTIEPLLSSHAAGALDETSEDRVRDHLAACAACRAAQVERDPTALFLELRRVPLPDGFLDSLAADVRKRVEARRRRPALFGRDVFRVPRLAYIAAPVMTLILLGTLFLVRPGGPAFHGARRPPEGAVTSPFERTGAGTAGEPRPLQTMGAPPASVVQGTAAPPLLEEVGSPSARVYRFTVTSGGDETPIYFVVDESIDIR